MSGFGLDRGLVDPALVSPTVAHLPPRPEMGRPEDLALRLGREPDSFACLASNENPLGPSELAMEAVRSALGTLHRYPDAFARRLRLALAERLGVTEEQIFVGNGSSEIIELLVRTFVGPGQTVLGAWPSFAAYRAAAETAGREFLPAPLRKGRVDLAALSALLDARTKLVFIANPNNPTGTHVSLRELVAFLNRTPRDAIVVIDEAYWEYVDASDYPASISDLLPGYPRLVVLRSFSKAYGLAGLRVGFAVMAPKLVRYLESVQAVFSINAAALVAAEAALADEEHVERARRLVFRERQRLHEALTRMGLAPYRSQGNFVYVGGLPHGTAAKLEERGVLVRCMKGYGAPDALRVSIGAPEANARFLAELDGLLDAPRPPPSEDIP